MGSLCGYRPSAIGSFHQLSRQRGTEIPACLEIVLARLARHHDGVGGLRPAQSGRNGVDSPLGALGALVAVQEYPERSSSGGVEARVVADIERMLHRAAHVAEVGRGTQQITVGLE